MGQELETIIGQLLGENYTEDEIEQALVKKGYKKEEIEQVFSDLNNEGESTFEKINSGFWLVSFVLMVVFYIFMTLKPYQMLGILKKGLSSPVSIYIMVFTALNLIASILKAKRKGFWEALIPFGFIVIVIGQVLSVFLILNPDLPIGQTGFGILSVVTNIFLFSFSLLTSLKLKKYLGKLSYSFIIIFLLIMVGLSLSYQVTIMQNLDSFKLDLSSNALEVPYNEENIIRTNRLVMPPFNNLESIIQSRASIAANYAYIAGLADLALKNSVKTPFNPGTRTIFNSEGEYCSGTLANIRKKYSKGKQMRYNDITMQTMMTRYLSQNKKKMIDGLYKKCQNETGCNDDRGEIAADYQKLVNAYQETPESLRNILGVSQEGFKVEEVLVKNCSSQNKYYGIKIKDVSCKDKFKLTLENTGTRSISPGGDLSEKNLIKLAIKDDVLIVGKHTYKQESNWTSGEKEIEVDVSDLGRREDFKFNSSKNYYIEVNFPGETNLNFEVACEGGNSFCGSCYNGTR